MCVCVCVCVCVCLYVDIYTYILLHTHIYCRNCFKEQHLSVQSKSFKTVKRYSNWY